MATAIKWLITTIIPVTSAASEGGPNVGTGSSERRNAATS